MGRKGGPVAILWPLNTVHTCPVRAAEQPGPQRLLVLQEAFRAQSQGFMLQMLVTPSRMLSSENSDPVPPHRGRREEEREGHRQPGQAHGKIPSATAASPSLPRSQSPTPRIIKQANR